MTRPYPYDLLTPVNPLYPVPMPHDHDCEIRPREGTMTVKNLEAQLTIKRVRRSDNLYQYGYVATISVPGVVGVGTAIEPTLQVAVSNALDMFLNEMIADCFLTYTKEPCLPGDPCWPRDTED